MLLLTYDPNVKQTLPEYIPEEPKRNYSISLASPYGSEERMRQIQQQMLTFAWFGILAAFLPKVEG